MNYKNIYDELVIRGCERASTRKEALSIFGYVEKHHIKPKCMGGSDKRDNLVYFSAKEHYLAHQLLLKMFPKHPGLAEACGRMLHDRYGNRLNLKSYEWIRCKIAQERRERMIGKTKHNNKQVAKITSKLYKLSNEQVLELIMLKETKFYTQLQLQKHFLEKYDISLALTTITKIYSRAINDGISTNLCKRILSDEHITLLINLRDNNFLTLKQIVCYFWENFEIKISLHNITKIYNNATKQGLTKNIKQKKTTPEQEFEVYQLTLKKMTWKDIVVYLKTQYNVDIKQCTIGAICARERKKVQNKEINQSSSSVI